MALTPRCGPSRSENRRLPRRLQPLALGAIAEQQLQGRDQTRWIRSALSAVGGTKGVVHGDAHPWNLLRTDLGWCWIDLEETGFARSGMGPRRDGMKVGAADVALRAYASTVGGPEVAFERLVPFQRIRELESVIWELAVAVTLPGLRAGAEQRLRQLLERLT